MGRPTLQLQQQLRYICYCCDSTTTFIDKSGVHVWRLNLPTTFVLCESCAHWVASISKEGVLRHTRRVILPPKQCVCCDTIRASGWLRNTDGLGIVTGWICKDCWSWLIYERKYPPGAYHKKGEQNPMYGKKHTEETKARMLARKKRLGPLRQMIVSSEKYQIWRTTVFQRDDYTCQICGIRGRNNLEAHHVKPYALIIKENHITTLDEAYRCSELWDTTNGQTLCKECHRKLPKSYKNYKK